MNDELGPVQPAHTDGLPVVAGAGLQGLPRRPESKRSSALPTVEPRPESKDSPKEHDKLLLDMLRRLNMAFDLFEIQAKFEFLEDGNRVHITVRNTATGKVIRRIPPTELQTNFNNLREGMGLIVNQSI